MLTECPYSQITLLTVKRKVNLSFDKRENLTLKSVYNGIAKVQAIYTRLIIY